LSYSVTPKLVKMFDKDVSTALIDMGDHERLFSFSQIPLTRNFNKVVFGGTSNTIDQKLGNQKESWYVVTCISCNDVMATLHKTDDGQILSGFMATGLLALISFYLSGMISAPIKKLAMAATLVGQGNLDSKIEIKSNDEIGKTALAFTEMTNDLKKARAENDALMQENIRAAQLAVLGTLAVGVAHEINNPTQGILNLATMINNAPENSSRSEECSKRIIKESERIASITKNLLFYAKENKHEFTLSNLRALSESALSLIDAKIDKAGVNMELSFPEDIPDVYVIPQMYQQIILNLVDNSYDSLRISKTKESTPIIKVSARIEGSHILVEVSDNGCGMSKEVAEKATKPFFTTKPSNEGTGLGLAIVSEIVAKHRGELFINSIPMESTTVTVKLDLPSNSHDI